MATAYVIHVSDDGLYGVYTSLKRVDEEIRSVWYDKGTIDGKPYSKRLLRECLNARNYSIVKTAGSWMTIECYLINFWMGEK